MRRIFLLVLIILIIISVLFIAVGCGPACAIQKEKCEYDCGEGWVSGLCKTGCTIEYKDCQKRR